MKDQIVQTEFAENKPVLHKVVMVMSFLMGLSFVYGIILGCISELSFLLNLNDVKPPYILEKSVVFGLLFSIPFSLCISYGAYLQLVNKLTENIKVFFIKTAAFAFFMFIIFGFIGNYASESYLESKGYGYCSWYTGSTRASPDVWLRDPRLCLKSGSIFAVSIREWLYQQDEQGIQPSVEQLDAFIKEQHAARDAILHDF